jgi:hypothetical protein
MAVLEIGINYGLKSLLELRYYKASDNVLDPKIRARFLSGVQSYISEVYNDKITAISFAEFQFVCYYKRFQDLEETPSDLQILIAFAITEKETDSDFVKKHLKEIISEFLKNYSIDEMITEDPPTFKPFENKINEILADLKFKLADRIGTLFR